MSNEINATGPGTPGPKKTTGKNGSNYTVLIACVVFVASMVGMSYAAVPLYRLYCQVTGFNGTTQRVEQASTTILDRKMRVEFDANTASTVMWDFKPENRSVDVRIGETVQVMFTARNLGKETATAQAIFNVTPLQAGAYFNKVECFCFTDVTLKAGESREMPVVFFIDPEIVNQPETKSVNTITLSYTFYAKQPDKPVAQAPESGKAIETKL